nr:MAG TPA: hypothetical protein [Caudoviricetes sp.]
MLYIDLTQKYRNSYFYSINFLYVFARLIQKIALHLIPLSPPLFCPINVHCSSRLPKSPNS